MPDQEGAVDRRMRGLDFGRQAREIGGDMGGVAHDQAEERGQLIGHDWRSTRAAVATHHGGHALTHLHRHARVGDQRGVVMRVHVDEAGCHDPPAGVDLRVAMQRRAGRGIAMSADRADAIAGHADVCPIARRAAAVDDIAPQNDQVVCCLVCRHVPCRLSCAACSERTECSDHAVDAAVCRFHATWYGRLSILS